MKKHRFISGFTLVELMVTLAVASILFTVAAPSFNQFVSSNNASNAAERLASIFAYARSEAVVRVENVLVCATTDGANCVVGGTDEDWGSGWLVTSPSAGVLKVESVASLSVDFVVTDDNGIELNGLTSVCFDKFGEECDGLFPFIIFTVNANGESSFKRLNSSGAVSL